MRMEEIFRGKKKIAIGMAHPLPLPGSCRYGGESMDVITSKLLDEVSYYDTFGYDGVILQNFSDIQVKDRSSFEAVACMTHLASMVKQTYPNLILGILMIWDGCASLAVAEAMGADFVRVEHVYTGAEVTPAGIIEGQCAEILAMKKRLQSDMPIFADVYEPHAMAICPKPIEEAAHDTVYSCFADGIFLCGRTVDESSELLRRVRTTVPDAPVILGGGSRGDNVYNLLMEFDGVCIGAWIKDGSLLNPINPERAKLYMAEVERARNA